jgi:hypothetical protein
MVHRQCLNRMWRCRMAPGVARWCLPGVARWPLALPDSGALPAGMGHARRPSALSCLISACDLALPAGLGVAGWRGSCPPPPKIFEQGLGQERAKHVCSKYGHTSRDLQPSRRFDCGTNRVGQRCKLLELSQPQVGSWRSEPFRRPHG